MTPWHSKLCHDTINLPRNDELSDSMGPVAMYDYSSEWLVQSCEFERADQYFLMGMDDLYASNRSYDGAVPGAVNPIDWIGPLWYVGGIGCRRVLPMLLELLHLQHVRNYASYRRWIWTCIVLKNKNLEAWELGQFPKKVIISKQMSCDIIFQEHTIVPRENYYLENSMHKRIKKVLLLLSAWPNKR